MRALSGRTDWRAIVALYGLLADHAPTLGVLVAQAAATCEAGEPAAARARLDALPADWVQGYQPYWVTRAHVLARLGDAGAAAARRRAIGLTQDPAIRAYLARARDGGS